MTKQLTDDIVQGMLSFLDNAQLKQLRDVVETTLSGYEITERKETNDSFDTNQNLLSSFLSAKRIEGCSENTLKYYRKTIEMMFATINKSISHIVTDDLRQYLTDYQKQNNSSKVTIDNIRRILSSFFSWLEDEDCILKSPVRRIHKVKSATIIKETYTDEALEQMRDSCDSLVIWRLLICLLQQVCVSENLFCSTAVILTLKSENALFSVKAARSEWCTLTQGLRYIFKTTLKVAQTTTKHCSYH